MIFHMNTDPNTKKEEEKEKPTTYDDFTNEREVIWASRQDERESRELLQEEGRED